MDQWQGVVVGLVCLAITAVVSRWVRRLVERRTAAKRVASQPIASRQVRRAQSRRQR